MARYTPSNVGSGYQSQSSLNINFADISLAIGDMLSRKGDSPNYMETSLDMNSNRLYNLPSPSTDAEPLRLGDIPLLSLADEAIPAISSLTKGLVVGNTGTTYAWVTSIRCVDSIDDLRNFDSTTLLDGAILFVPGFYGVGTLGGGNYYFDDADSTTADNGGTIIVGNDGARYKYASSRETICVETFGALGDATTDDITAFEDYEAMLEDAGGGDFRLSEGKQYLLGSTWNIVHDNINIVGVGCAGQDSRGLGVPVNGFAGTSEILIDHSGWGIIQNAPDGAANGQKYNAGRHRDFMVRPASGATPVGLVRFQSMSNGRLRDVTICDNTAGIGIEWLGWDTFSNVQRECQYWESYGLIVFNCLVNVNLHSTFSMKFFGCFIQGYEAANHTYRNDSIGWLVTGPGDGHVWVGCNTQMIEYGWIFDSRNFSVDSSGVVTRNYGGGSPSTANMANHQLINCRLEAFKFGVDCYKMAFPHVESIRTGNSILTGTDPDTGLAFVLPFGTVFRADANCTNIYCTVRNAPTSDIATVFDIDASATITHIANNAGTGTTTVRQTKGYNATQHIAYPQTTDNAATGGIVVYNSNGGSFHKFTLTGNVTIANPTPMSINGATVGGDMLYILLVQDATGGRTVGFGTDFNHPTYTNTGNTANTKCFLVFVYDKDSATWEEVSCRTWI